jgi:hypothetical protein
LPFYKIIVILRRCNREDADTHIATMHRRKDLPLYITLTDTYNSVILSVAKNLKVSKRVEWRTAPETLHVVQGDTIITIWQHRTNEAYYPVILSVVKNLKDSKRVEWRTSLETLHVVQGDTIITIWQHQNK